MIMRAWDPGIAWHEMPATGIIQDPPDTETPTKKLVQVLFGREKKRRRG